jgi:hypothetical protein
VSDRASEQLAALAETAALLEAAGIDYWLFGGWAVDFWVGAVTRAHDDLDVAVWLADLPRIRALLADAGWRHAPHADEDGGTGFERGGVRLELTYLVRDGEGRTAIPFRDGLAVWAAGGFAGDAGVLGGVRSRLMARTALAGGKSVPRDDPDDAAKDDADFRALSRLAPPPR